MWPPGPVRFRRRVALLTTSLLTGTLLCLTFLYPIAKKFPPSLPLASPPLLNESEYLISTRQCIIHRIPIFTNETLSLYKKLPGPSDYNCSKRSPGDAIVRHNATAIFIPSTLSGCRATEILYTPSKADSKLASEKTLYGRIFRNIGPGIVDFPSSDALIVNCDDKVEKLVLLVPEKKPFKWSDVPVPEPSPRPPINVLLLGIDAVSRLNFHRHFVRSVAFLSQHNFTSLLAHHKVGDNTMPNLFGMFLGERKGTWWPRLPPTRKLDSLPFIFKRYSNGGYLTTYIEDYPLCGLFTFHGVNGFTRQPTEYYLRPVNIWLRNNGLYDKTWCYADKLEMEHYYEYVLTQLSAFRNRSKPHLTWIHQSTVSHEELNNCQYTDGPLYRLLSTLFASKLNENTVIMLYSDHAIRIGPILDTESGFHETRLPFLYLYVPDGIALQSGAPDRWLSSEQLRTVLQGNAHRLTSHLDIHATLRHILTSLPPTDEPYGRSLFTPIPLERTCADAGIPSEYCLCQSYTAFTRPQSAEAVANRLVHQLNVQLEPFLYLCAQLELKTVVKAKIAVDGKNRSKALLSLVFTVAPSEAKFDATVRTVLLDGGKSLDLEQTETVGQIARNDRYAEQSQCVTGKAIQPLCYCKNLLGENGVKGAN